MARPVLNTIRSLSSVVAVGTGAAVAGLLIVRQALPPGVLAGTGDAVGNYLQTLGTLYAVLLAFVVFVVWSQFNDARAHVDREANEILDLFRTAKGLADPARDGIQMHARAYVKAILGGEWVAMRCPQNREVIDEGWAIVDRMWDVVHTYEPGTKCHEGVHAELLARFNELSDARTLRLAASKERVPLALKVLIYLGAVLTTGSMYLMDVGPAWIHAVMTGAVAGAIAHILYIIHDLDDCFSGDWQVSTAPYEQVLAYMERTRAWPS